MVSPEEQLRYLNTYVYPVLMDGVYAMAKQQPNDPVLGLAQWLWRHNPNRPMMCLFPIRLFDEIETMKENCRQWQMQNSLFPDGGLSQNDELRAASGLSVIAELDECEDFQRCNINA